MTISIVLHVLGVRPYLSAQGIDYNSLAAFGPSDLEDLLPPVRLPETLRFTSVT